MAIKKTGKTLVYILLAFIMLGMVFWNRVGFSGSVLNVGTVGNQSISVKAYGRALQDQIRAAQQQIGATLTFEQAQGFGLDRLALAGLISDAAVDEEAARLGISVGDARVQAAIVSIPAFQGPDGKFDRSTYKYTLDRLGLSEAEFERGVRSDLTRSVLQGAIAGGVALPDAYGRTFAAFAGETRDFVWAKVTAADLIESPAAPTADEVQAYYDANATVFTVPETKTISYAWLSPDMIAADAPVDEQQLRELYQSRINDYVIPERRLVERLGFADAATAEAAMAEIAAGTKTFDDLVTERGLRLSDVDMGDVGQSEIGAAGAAVFAATAGDVVGPFDSSIGPAIYRMNAILAAQETTFDEAKDELRSETAMAAARRSISDQSSHMTDLLAGGASLEDLSNETGMQLGQIDWTEGSSDGIAAYDAFRTAAQALGNGDFPSLVYLEDGGVVVLRLDNLTPAHVRPLSEVMVQAATATRAAAIDAAVLARAQDIAAGLDAQSDLAALGLTPSVETGIVRSAFIEETPQQFVATVFTLAPGQATAMANGTQGALVVRLDAVTPVDEADPALVTVRQQLAAQVAQDISRDMLNVFDAQMQSQTKINIDQSTIDAVNAQYR